MADESPGSGDREPVDPETVATRLESVEEYLGNLRESNPYYAWLHHGGPVRLRHPGATARRSE